MKTYLANGMVAVVLALAATTVCAASSEESHWMVRLRAVTIDPVEHSEAGSGAITPTQLPEDAIQVSHKTIPELDISYFYTKHIATELVLTYPQKHSVSINSGPLAESIGSFKELPPTLTLQYHFLPENQFRPYLGAGVNYTHISSVQLHSNTAGVDLDLKRNSVGPVIQAGMDIKIGQNMYLNLDIKKAYIRTDVTLNGDKVSEVKVDPLLIGIGIGWTF